MILLLILFFALIIGLGFYLSKGKEEKKEEKAEGGPEPNVSMPNVVSLTDETKEEIVKEEKRQEKEEKKEDVKNETQNSYRGDYFSVSYPSSWQAEKVNKTTVGFGKRDRGRGPSDISVSYKENNKKLPIERYYDGINDVNLFEDAFGGFEKTEVGGSPAFKFKNLAGETPSTVLVIVLDKAFLEISDNYNEHQGDGIFDSFISSLEVK